VYFCATKVAFGNKVLRQEYFFSKNSDFYFVDKIFCSTFATSPWLVAKLSVGLELPSKDTDTTS